MIETAPVSEDKLTFDEAWLYVLLLDYNNKKDWRLPEFSEYVYELYDVNITGSLWYADNSSNNYSINRHTLPVRTKDV